MTAGFFDFVCLSFDCVSASHMEFDNIFSDFHGGFGLILHDHFPLVYADLFETQSNAETTRSYALYPNMSFNGDIDSGTQFSVQLFLYGKLTRHALDCAHAVGLLGLHGVTSRKYRFHVAAMHVLEPDSMAHGVIKDQLLWSKSTGWRMHALSVFDTHQLKGDFQTPTMDDALQVAITLVTPLRAKKNGVILKQGVDAITLFNRVLGRIQMLSSSPGAPAFFSRQEKDMLRQYIDQVHTDCQDQTWVSMRRRTKKHAEAADFGGLLGGLVVSNVHPHLIRVLELGVWLGVGNKTSFGLGRISYAKRNGSLV